MACSKQSTASHDAITSMIECGICLSEMFNPKALPCLHSFCLECLKEVEHPPGIFFCPLCQEKTALPPGGVDGFRNNFFMYQLKDIKAISTKEKIRKPCVRCGAESCEIVACCVDCNGFICQQCVKLHQTIAVMKVHTVFTLEELQSGSIDMSKVMKEENCQKHKDQVQRWFCKTCNTAICRDCKVMDHVRPGHDYIAIDSANEARVKKIRALMENCKDVNQQLMHAITNTEKVETNLTKSVDNIRKQLGENKKAYLNAIERSHKQMLDKLSDIQAGKKRKIGNTKIELHNKKSKLDNAMEVADQIISSGSKHDLVSNYSSLCITLGDLQRVNATGAGQDLSEVKFRPSHKSQIKRVDLGSISATGPYTKHKNGKWVFEKEIGAGKIKLGKGVAISRNKDIYIADSQDNNVKAIDSDGNFKRLLQGNLKTPHDVAMAHDGTHQFVTDCTGLVHVFNSPGEKMNQFPAISPDGKASDTDGSTLYGLAVDNDGNILVGDSSKKYIRYNNTNYISKHRSDGIHISSFKINICPWSITVTQQGKIIACPGSDTNAEILDHNGKLLHIINKPPDAKSWYPWGCCCSDDGIVYVTSFSLTNDGGVYSFTEDGTYLGCVITDVIYAAGIALIDDDRLVLAQNVGHPVKIFCYKET